MCRQWNIDRELIRGEHFPLLALSWAFLSFQRGPGNPHSEGQRQKKGMSLFPRTEMSSAQPARQETCTQHSSGPHQPRLFQNWSVYNTTPICGKSISTPHFECLASSVSFHHSDVNQSARATRQCSFRANSISMSNGSPLCILPFQVDKVLDFTEFQLHFLQPDLQRNYIWFI